MIDFDQVTGKIGSSDFRKRYATLNEPTAVYSNGHYIGTWVPFALNDLAYARAIAGNVTGQYLPSGEIPTNEHGVPAPQLAAAWRTNSWRERPATPAPKPSKRSK